jgi:ribosomal protein S10
MNRLDNIRIKLVSYDQEHLLKFFEEIQNMVTR